MFDLFQLSFLGMKFVQMVLVALGWSEHYCIVLALHSIHRPTLLYRRPIRPHPLGGTLSCLVLGWHRPVLLYTRLTTLIGPHRPTLPYTPRPLKGVLHDT